MRKLEEKVIRVLMILSTVLVALGFISILIPICVKGLPAFNWDLISKVPTGGFYMGKEGGILNAIVGSFEVATISSLLGLCLALPLALYLNAYLTKRSLGAQAIRLTMDVLQGVPSIVYGACAFSLMIYLGWQASLGAGIFTMTILVFPLFVRSIDEVMKLTPSDLKQTALSLGGTSFTYATLLLRYCSGGILTAFLLGFGRVIGDAAALMFTAGFSDNIPTALSDQAPTLPLSIFFQLGSPVREVQERGYASALLLTIIVLLINFLVKYIRKKIVR